MCNLAKLKRAELAKLLGVDASTISRHKKRGMPVNADGKTFNASICVAWAISQVEQAASKDAGESDESRKWLTAFRRERAKMAKIERLKAEGELIPKGDIASMWVNRISTLRSGLLALAARLAPLVENKPQLKIRQIIGDEVYVLLDTYSKGGRYCPKTPEVRKILSDLKKVMRLKK